VVCHAAVPVGDVPAGDHGVAIVELPGIAEAATLIHHGPMADVDSTMQILAAWLDEHGYQPTDGRFAREIYLDYDPARPEEGVTEMQLPVRPVRKV
jgi:effector-binding domain-containing protein